jgi:indolepyruvate ferredoxin oxidoreductase
MKVDPRFLKEEGTEVYTGNELLVKGLLETDGGTHLWTGYPGSPVAGFFDTIESIQEIPKQYGISAVIANNEALSAAMVNGSQMLGLRAITVMKSVGLHVAADALAIGNLAGAHPDGGVVVVCGDDPWSDSTQVPADSRYLAKHLHMPMVEPSTYQELKDWIDLSFKLSRESELYVGYLVTTNQADGGGSVTTSRNHFPKVNTQQKATIDTAKVDFEKMVLLPPRTWRREQNLPERYARLWQSAAKYGLNKLSLPVGGSARSGAGKAPVGFVTSAMAACYLDHALRELGLTGAVPILKLGVTYPIDPALIADFAGRVEQIVVVEERRGFIEEQIALILSELGQAHMVPLYGKKFPHGLKGFPAARGLNPSLVIQTLAPLFLKVADPRLPVDEDLVRAELALIELTATYQIDLAPRTPTFCAGCPHRDSATVLVEVKKDFRDAPYMRKRHRREPVDLVFHGDTGCYTMLMFEPTKDLMHNYSGMGLGGATGLGIDPFIGNKQVVFMGDSTFFHSGQVAISNSIKNGQDITYIILDNKTTAMTGHQPTPGIETDILGNTTFVQSIDKIIGAIADGPHVEVIRVNPGYRDQYRALLEDTILKDGVKILIADKECGITFHRRKNREERAEAKKRGYVKRKTFININPDVCEYCLECTKATGCPGLTFTETDFGRKIQTDLSWCVADTACTKIHACPSFEEITVVRHQKPVSRLPVIKDEELPPPPMPTFDDRWQVYLAGVGGMGIASATATLVRAAHREGYHVLFCDKNGLAIRNGGVYSQVTFLQPGKNHTSSVISYGKADLILGIDALEAARSIDPSGTQRVGSVSHTTAILNTAKTPTILSLLGRDDFAVDSLEASLRRYTRGDDYFSGDISEMSERVFGTKIYANIMMLGVAFQRGQLPLSLNSIEWGIRETVGGAAGDNYLAFKIGRKMVADAERATAGDAEDANDVLEAKAALLVRQGGEKLARGYRRLVRQGLDTLHLDARNRAHLATRLYDLIRFEDLDYATDYLDRLSAIHQKDDARFGYAATAAALWNLHRVMVIKDEVYVAHLLTSDEKYERDRQRYNIDPALGDKAVYGHLNRPEFVIGGSRIRFHLKSRPWMLRLMRHGKPLRRLLPAWHAKEKAFRAWYLDLSSRFAVTERQGYRQWVSVLRLPEQVTGYREVRYPKMDEARRRAEQLLNESPLAAAAASASESPAPGIPAPARRAGK